MQKNVLKKVVMSFIFCFLLFAGKNGIAKEILLGREGEQVFNYLVLTEALRNGDEAHIESAIQGLLNDKPYLPVFQDGVTILLSRKNYTAAIAIAKKGLIFFPDDSVLTSLLSAVYSESGENEKAISLLKRHLAKNSNDKEAKQELVRIYLQNGENSKATSLLKELGGEEENPMVTFFRCKLLVTTEKYKQAKTELKKLLKEYPNFVEAWIELAFVAEQDNDTEQAIRAYKSALYIIKDNTDLRLRLIRLLLSQKKLDEALAEINKSSDNTDFILQSSIYLTKEGYIKQAKEFIEQAKKSGADAQLADYYLSDIIYSETHDPEKALIPLNNIVETSSYFLSASQRKIELLLEAQKGEKASTVAAHLRKVMPENITVWEIEAFTLFKNGKNTEAIAILKKGLKKFPNNEDILVALGSMLEETGKRKEALEIMEKIITINPKNARALNFIGYTLTLEKRDLERALDLILTAQEEEPDSSDILDSLAWVYYQMEKYQEAWTVIQKCLPLTAENATVYDHYADIAVALGKKEIARKSYNKALTLHPNNELEIRSKLKKLGK